MGNRLGTERETLLLNRPDGKTFKVKTYSPQKTPLGLVVISPGAGGSENGLGYLAEYFFMDGWLVCVMEHLESNLAALKMHIREEGGLKEGLVEMVTDPSAYPNMTFDKTVVYLCFSFASCTMVATDIFALVWSSAVTRSAVKAPGLWRRGSADSRISVPSMSGTILR